MTQAPDSAELFQRPVRLGWWLYDSAIEKPVWIVEQNYDHFFEMDRENFREWGRDFSARPRLNRHGLCYGIAFLKNFDSDGFQIRDQALTVRTAMRIASRIAPSAIKWDAASDG